MLYNVASAVLRSIGDTVTSLCFLIGSTVINVLLDLLLICEFHARVRGAAFATVISQLLSSVACIVVYAWVRYPLLRLRKQDFHFCIKTVKEMLVSGCSMGFMSCLVSIGSVALQTRINVFGNNTIVAHTAARELTSFFMLPFPVLATAMATYCSQNLGAGEMDRIKKGIRSSLGIAFVWCWVVVVITYTIVPTLVYGVTGTRTKEILDTASLYLRVDTSFYVVVAVVIIIWNVLQGIGNNTVPIISSGIELLTKVAAAVVLAPKLGYWAIILAEPISWILMVIPLLIQL